MDKGWIKLHRKITENPMYFSERFTRMQAWIDLLIMANHGGRIIYIRGNKVEVKRGEIARSTEGLAQRWMWSRGKVIRFLNELENSKMIVQQKNRVITLLSILNYDVYQSDGTTDKTADEQQTVHEQECKNVKNDNINKEATKKNKSVSEKIEDYLGMIPENWREPVEIWLNYKKERKEIYKTGRSFKSFFKTIEKESQNNPAIFLAAVEQSIKNNWSGVFPKKHAVEKHPMVDHSKQKVYDEF
ncbi:hypothetical protein DSECCO2_197430 [anaerobic digester metagenome]